MTQTSQTLLQINNVSKYYGALGALRNVNLTVTSGKIIGLLGPNGSGKTTLMKLINQLLIPTTGTIFYQNRELDVKAKNDIAYLPDKNYLNDWMKVSDLVEYFKDFYTNFDENRAYEMLDNLKIPRSFKLKNLSKGTKEKVQLILVMSRRAKLYLLDEPIGGVDPASREYILRTIISNYSEDSTIIISTHLISDVETVLDDVVFLKNGEVVLVDSVDNIRQSRAMSVDELFREEFRC